MPRYTKEGFAPIETAVPSEGVELVAQGFTEHVAKTKAVKEADAEASK